MADAADRLHISHSHAFPPTSTTGGVLTVPAFLILRRGSMTQFCAGGTSGYIIFLLIKEEKHIGKAPC